jgi:hypothetical protein
VAKLIITDAEGNNTNLLLELDDGSQVEVNAPWEQLIEAVIRGDQSVLEVKQNQPQIA